MSKLNKKQKKNFMIGVVIVSIILIFLLASGKIKSPFVTIPLSSDLGQCRGGWTSFSISRVDIVGVGNRIRIYGVAKGSECMQVALTKEQLNNYLSGNYEATKPIYASIRMTEYTKTFPIDQSTECYKSIESKNIGTQILPICSVKECIKEGAPSTTFDTYLSGILYQCNCIYSGCNGESGDFSAARSYGNFKVEFKYGDYSPVYVTREDQAVSFANGKARIEWTGNLENLDQIYPPQYDGRLIESKWHLVQDGALSRVEQELSNFKNCYGSIQTSSKFNSCKDIFERNTASILTNKNSEYETRSSNLIYDMDTDKNNLYVSLKAPPFPTFILDLDAEWVGIVPLEGKPKITQCIPNQDNLLSGSPKTVSFKVKNDASVSAEFYGSVTCDKGATGYVTNLQIGANQERIITAELIPNNQNINDLIGLCTLRITDLKSGNSDTCVFGIKVKYQSGIICEPNSLSCDDKFQNLIKCSSDGTNKALFKECVYGCEYATTGAKCRDEPPIPPQAECKTCDEFALSKILGSIWKSKQCKDGKMLIGLIPMTVTTCLFSFIKYLLIPLVLIFATLFGTQIFGKIKALKGNQVAIWLISLVVAGIISYIVFVSFWVGLIGFIIYLIISSAIKVGGVTNIPKKIFRR